MACDDEELFDRQVTALTGGQLRKALEVRSGRYYRRTGR
jgi:hypothetical protein